MPKQTYFNLSEEKKERIRTATMVLFGSLPYEEVTTRLLVKEAGISMGSLYQYFDSKDEMYIFYIDELFLRMKQKGVYEEALGAKDETYSLERKFFHSMFNAPASVLEQYYFSKETWTYRLLVEDFQREKAQGIMPVDYDEGLVTFLKGAISLGVIMYTRSLGIREPEDYERFLRENFGAISNAWGYRDFSGLMGTDFRPEKEPKHKAKREK